MVSNASNCRRRDGVYWFRRRIPQNLVVRLGINEIHRSLGTGCPREAARRARRAWLLTQDLFDAMANDMSLNAEYAKMLLGRLTAEPVHSSPTADALITAWCGGDSSQIRQLRTPEAIAEILKLSPTQYAQVCAHMERICDKTEIEVARHAEAMSHARSEIARAKAANAERLLKEVVLDRGAMPMAPPRAPPPAEATIGAQEQPQAKRLSEYETPFFQTKRYPKHTESQTAVTFRLWKEINGDLPIDKYTRAHAQEFQRRLRLMPSVHGKAKKYTNVHESIELTKGTDIRLLSEKTIQRHVSSLRQLWAHVGDEIANPKIFNNIKHDIEDSDRLPWTTDLLDRLLRARWPQNQVSEETHAWFVAIGGYTGARLEEIAQIRAEDVRERDGVPSFEIKNHYETTPGGRRVQTGSTKTPASNRVVPLHPKLLALGFWDLAQHRRAGGHTYLFDLGAGGTQNKLSPVYSKLFSNHKIRLGFGKEYVFHSFRHNVETILGSSPHRQEWIDAFMGHSSGSSKSVGLKVYRHGVTTEVLRQVAYAVEYPPEVCPTLLLKRVRGEVPW